MLKFNPSFVYRTPGRPVSAFADGNNFDSVDDYLRHALADKDVQEAIYGSSPAFYTEVERFLVGGYYEGIAPKKIRKFRITALKYLNRFSYRATPYGMFAGCGSGKVLDSRAEKVPVKDLSFRRVVKLDAAYLMYIANELAAKPGVSFLLRFYPNNTIVQVGDKSRYVEFIDAEKGRAYNLSVFTNTEYTDQVLQRAANGVTGAELCEMFAEDDIAASEAIMFVDQLAAAKILISELEPMVVGQTFQEQLEDSLAGMIRISDPASEAGVVVRRYYAHLQELYEALALVAEHGRVRDYRAVEDIVTAFHGKPYPNIIRMDAAIETDAAPDFDFKTARHIQKGLMAFTKLCGISSNSSVATFKNKFVERYEDQFVPALVALDPEIGVGFENVGSEMYSFAPLVDNLPVGPRLSTSRKKTIEWNYQLHSFFLNKITAAQAAGKTVVELTDEDLAAFNYDINHMPPTSAAMLELIPTGDPNKPLVYFKDLGKDTGAALISRFAHTSPDIKEMVDDLCAYEDEAFSGCMVAEVNHLANLRIGNITERPRSRKHEIAFITKSNSREEGLIPVADIYIGIRNEKVVLINIKTGQEIIPRVSTAHNYSFNCLPLYKFLACLQEEYHQGYYQYLLDLGPIPTMLDFVPRIQYEEFIFRPATWKIPTRPIKKLKEQSFADFHADLLTLFAERKWPTAFTIREGGTPVLIDIENQLGAYLLSDMLSSSHVRITEAIGQEPDNQWFKADGVGYHHELLLPFRNEVFKGYGPMPVPTVIRDVPGIDRRIAPSDEWLYLKLYAGAGTIEKLISERLPRLLNGWKKDELITSFFFLRLTDPDYHLRLRVKPTDYAAIGQILESFNACFGADLKSGFVQKIQIDTYRREVERYGGPLVIPSEELFAIDSELVLRLKNIMVAEVNKDFDWVLMFKVMTIYLEVFGLEGKSALSFLKERRETFSYIFNTNKLQKRNLIQRYLNNEELLGQVMNDTGSPFTDEAGLYQTMEWFRTALTAWYETKLKDVAAEKRTELLRSYIHMFILRFANGKNKLHEHVLFFLMERYFLQHGHKQRSAEGQPVV